MFAKWVNNKVGEKINTRINVLNNTHHKHKHKVSLNVPDTKMALELIHSRFEVVMIDKASGNIALT